MIKLNHTKTLLGILQGAFIRFIYPAGNNKSDLSIEMIC